MTHEISRSEVLVALRLCLGAQRCNMWPALIRQDSLCVPYASSFICFNFTVSGCALRSIRARRESFRETVQQKRSPVAAPPAADSGVTLHTCHTGLVE